MDSFPELKNYYLSETHSDLILIIDGNRLPSHKFVLSAKSPVFSAMLFGSLSDTNSSDIEIKEAPIDAFKVMLRYVYTEQFLLDNEKDSLMAIEVFKLAHRFQLNRLTQIIEQSLIKMLKKHNYLRINDSYFASYEESITKRKFESSLMIIIENISTLYEFSLIYELNELINSCERFIAKNSKLIIKKKAFMSKSLDIMESILSVMNTSQAMIITALQNIRDFHPDTDLKQFHKLIIFDNCSADDMNCLKNIQLFPNDMLFDKLINKYKALQIENTKLLKGEKLSNK